MVLRPTPSRSSNNRNLFEPHACLARPSHRPCIEHSRSQEQHPVAKTSLFLTLTSIPTMVHTPPSDDISDVEEHSGFLRLPAEIRLQIYHLLFLPRKSSDLRPNQQKVQSSLQDSFDYVKRQRGTDRVLNGDVYNPTLLIRTMDGDVYKQRYGLKQSHATHRRKDFGVSGRFRVRYVDTTYHCVNNPRLEDNMGVMCANRQIHAEAAEVLYGSYTFDFDYHVEAVAPFFSDLTPFARSCVKSIRLVKRALAYDREYDRCEWSNALRFLTSSSSNISLRRLELGVVAGQPGPNGWDRIATYSASDFKLLKDASNMQWLQYVLEVQGLKELDVTAVIEHCPPATNSMAMAEFIRFSASVEGGFAQYLHSIMLPAKSVPMDQLAQGMQSLMI